MKKILSGSVLLFGIALASTMTTGCGYAGVAAVNDGAQVVILRNDGFLFGLLRKVYVCDVVDTGVTNCQEGGAP